jgi:prephenate dehydratase
MENQIKKRIAIQGGIGSFHEIAAISQYGSENIVTNCCRTFSELVAAVEQNIADIGLIAIENTVAGSLIGNYALLEGAQVNVIGEILLRIEQNLMAMPGQSLQAISEVYSHPIALMQCSRFLESLPNIRLIESDDTALSAAKIKKDNTMGAAAIASKRAAELYGLEILSEGIETNKRNFTRFLIIVNKNSTETSISNPDKASISFTLPHKTGSLAKVLSVFMFYDISLTKIQSIPVIGKEWEYHFLIDLVFSDFSMYKQSLTAINPLISGLHILGEYCRATKSLDSNEIMVTNFPETIEIC